MTKKKIAILASLAIVCMFLMGASYDVILDLNVAPSAGQILIGNAGGTAYVPQSLSGDITNTSAGVVTISNLAVTNAKIAASTIDLTAKVTGALPIANGGSNSATALNGGRPIISNASAIVESSGYSGVKTSNYQIVVGDCNSVIDADASGGAVAITLPAVGAGNKGFRVTIRNVGASASPTVVPTASDGIDGTYVTHTLNAKYSSMTLVSTGTTGAAAGQGWIVERANDWLGVSVAQGAGSAIAASNTTQEVLSGTSRITLTPGEWDMSGIVLLTLGNASGLTQMSGMIATNAVGGGAAPGDSHQYSQGFPTSNGDGTAATIPSYRVSVTANTIYYLDVNVMGTVGTTMKAYGRISARRVR